MGNEILTTQSIIRKRFKQILDSRKKLAEDNFTIFMEKESFMKLNGNSKYLASDNPPASLKGFVDVDNYSIYYCPVEDFMDEELKELELRKK